MSESTLKPDLAAKIQHLQMIQAIISRMASNSFVLKGWSLTIASGASAFSIEKGKPILLVVGLGAAVIFWFLDGFFLHQERLFRDLYSRVAQTNHADVDFSMSTRGSCADECQLLFRLQHCLCASFSLTLLLFHGAIMLGMGILLCIHLKG